MTQQQFIEEIKRLSVAERAALLEIISRSLREDLEANAGAPAGDADVRADKLSAVRRLRGALKFDRPPPSDEEVKEIIADYLAEKYP